MNTGNWVYRLSRHPELIKITSVKLIETLIINTWYNTQRSLDTSFLSFREIQSYFDNYSVGLFTAWCEWRITSPSCCTARVWQPNSVRQIPMGRGHHPTVEIQKGDVTCQIEVNCRSRPPWDFYGNGVAWGLQSVSNGLHNRTKPGEGIDVRVAICWFMVVPSCIHLAPKICIDGPICSSPRVLCSINVHIQSMSTWQLRQKDSMARMGSHIVRLSVARTSCRLLRYGEASGFMQSSTEWYLALLLNWSIRYRPIQRLLFIYFRTAERTEYYWTVICCCRVFCSHSKGISMLGMSQRL